MGLVIPGRSLTEALRYSAAYCRHSSKHPAAHLGGHCRQQQPCCWHCVCQHPATGSPLAQQQQQQQQIHPVKTDSYSHNRVSIVAAGSFHPSPSIAGKINSQERAMQMSGFNADSQWQHGHCWHPRLQAY